MPEKRTVKPAQRNARGAKDAPPAEIHNRAQHDGPTGQREPLEAPRIRVQSHVTPKAVQRGGKDAVSREGLSRQARQATQKKKRAR